MTLVDSPLKSKIEILSRALIPNRNAITSLSSSPHTNFTNLLQFLPPSNSSILKTAFLLSMNQQISSGLCSKFGKLEASKLLILRLTVFCWRKLMGSNEPFNRYCSNHCNWGFVSFVSMLPLKCSLTCFAFFLALHERVAWSNLRRGLFTMIYLRKAKTSKR